MEPVADIEASLRPALVQSCVDGVAGSDFTRFDSSLSFAALVLQVVKRLARYKFTRVDGDPYAARGGRGSRYQCSHLIEANGVTRTLRG